MWKKKWIQRDGRFDPYNLNGTQISSVTADGEGRVALDLSSLPKGVYILRTPTKSFKFMNK